MKTKYIMFEYRVNYGVKLAYIVNPEQAELIKRITGKKTIDEATRDALTELTGNRIAFVEVMP